MSLEQCIFNRDKNAYTCWILIASMNYFSIYKKESANVDENIEL